jgi:hypothetical protein
MCQVGFSEYRKRQLVAAAYQVSPAGVGVLEVLLSHLGPWGAWPSASTLARELSGARRRTSERTVERAISRYVAAGILVAHRRQRRSTVYHLAPAWSAQIEAAGAPPRAQATLRASSSDRTVARDSLLNPLPIEQPLTPATPPAEGTAAEGASAPPAPSPVLPVEQDAGGGPPPAPPAPDQVVRELVASGGLEDLLAWYAVAWSQRHPDLVVRRAGRTYGYTSHPRQDARALRLLLLWSAQAGALRPLRWVELYLRAFLRLASDSDHALGDATRSSTAKLCRPRPPRSARSPAPPLELPRPAAADPPPADLRELLAELDRNLSEATPAAPRRRAASG